MAELHDLSPSKGSTRPRKRVGRGPGSGTGKTAGRGQKGQKARSGASIPAGFEGGQMPLHRRIPKGGFTPLNRVEYQVVNVRVLAELSDEALDPTILAERGVIGSARKPVKILGDGELDRAVKVEAHAFSGSARSKIEAAGGIASVIGADDQA
ncbi:MAG: 50S ribosomal protein L15 [Gemmatimonadales bacterium]|nr:MAG: 50S ribosomal protein L15 [Gemmatimonadales bacterium]